MANSLFCAIHDFFLPEPVTENGPISSKKILNQVSEWDVLKDILGFIFNGDTKTMWLSEGKRDTLIAMFLHWIQLSTKNLTFDIPSMEF